MSSILCLVHASISVAIYWLFTQREMCFCEGEHIVDIQLRAAQRNGSIYNTIEVYCCHAIVSSFQGESLSGGCVILLL